MSAANLRDAAREVLDAYDRRFMTVGRRLVGPIDGEVDALRAALVAAPALDDARDAARYRWLRGCSSMRSDRGAVTVNWPKFDNGTLIDGDRTLSGERLDAAIDARLQQEPRS